VRYLSVCSGIEAASVAWHPLGWQAVGFSEIEAFPRAVLAQRWPDVPLYGDMTQFKGWPDAAFDVLVGGTPCQSFSVAGLRKGLDDPRGNLMLVYLAIADRDRPEWLVWENVPGVLSSNSGRDFGAFLGGLAELGYGFAYRVLDAQYFGLPSDAAVCSLSQTLEAGNVPQRYFLSARACAGILRRAEKRGKELPAALLNALIAAASTARAATAT
jgi:DNA-cytosine methyltransferase